MKGRKRDSAPVRAAKGTATRRRRAPATAAKPTPSPAAPSLPGGIPRELTRQGKRVWQIVAPLLLTQKLLKPTDRLSLTRYCDTIAEYWRVTRELREKDYTYEAEKVGSGKMLRFNPLFIVQARHPLVSVRGATQSPLIFASFSSVTLSPRAFPLGLPVSLSHRKSDTRVRFARQGSRAGEPAAWRARPTRWVICRAAVGGPATGPRSPGKASWTVTAGRCRRGGGGLPDLARGRRRWRRAAPMSGARSWRRGSSAPMSAAARITIPPLSRARASPWGRPPVASRNLIPHDAGTCARV